MDDSSYTMWFSAKSYDECVELRSKLMKYLDTKLEVNGNEWFDFGKSKNIKINIITKKYNFENNSDSILTCICENSHIFDITKSDFLFRYSQIGINGRRFCQQCILPKQVEFLKSLELIGILPLNSNDYTDRKTSIEWLFSCGHIEFDKSKNIIERVKRNSNYNKCSKCNKNNK